MDRGPSGSSDGGICQLALTVPILGSGEGRWPSCPSPLWPRGGAAKAFSLAEFPGVLTLDQEGPPKTQSIAPEQHLYKTPAFGFRSDSTVAGPVIEPSRLQDPQHQDGHFPGGVGTDCRQGPRRKRWLEDVWTNSFTLTCLGIPDYGVPYMCSGPHIPTHDPGLPALTSQPATAPLHGHNVSQEVLTFWHVARGCIHCDPGSSS